jgi:hypothetical protein
MLGINETKSFESPDEFEQIKFPNGFYLTNLIKTISADNNLKYTFIIKDQTGTIKNVFLEMNMGEGVSIPYSYESTCDTYIKGVNIKTIISEGSATHNASTVCYDMLSSVSPPTISDVQAIIEQQENATNTTPTLTTTNIPDFTFTKEHMFILFVIIISIVVYISTSRKQNDTQQNYPQQNYPQQNVARIPQYA